MTADPRVVYALDRVSTLWAVRDALHPSAVGHRGVDWRLPNGGGSEVVAYERCTVVSTPFSSILGYCTVVRYADGVFGYWAHLRGGTRPNIGTVLEPGERVGLAATGGTWLPQMDPDFPGTAWAGVHIHHGIGPLLSSVFSGVTYDPLPRVRAALAALAGAGIGNIIVIDNGSTITVSINGNNGSPDDVALGQNIIPRSLFFHARERETKGRNLWEVLGDLSAQVDLTDIGHEAKGWPRVKAGLTRWLTFESRANGTGPTLHEAIKGAKDAADDAHAAVDKLAIAIAQGNTVNVTINKADLKAVFIDAEVVAAFATAFANEQARRLAD